MEAPDVGGGRGDLAGGKGDLDGDGAVRASPLLEGGPGGPHRLRADRPLPGLQVPAQGAE